jgi:serine/threonine-protein kinase
VERLLHHLARIPVGPVVAVIAVVGIWLMSSAPDASHRVPDLVGLEVNGAIARGTTEGYFVVHRFEKGPGVAGTVVDQEPDAGILVDKRSKIRIVVTRGVAQVKVPDVRGIQVDEARRRLDRGNVRPGDVTYRKHERVTSNRVITTVPAPGKLVDAYAKVDIIAAA